MAFLNDVPAKPLSIALRKYWGRVALMALEPFAAHIIEGAVHLAGIRAATGVPAFVLALWPAAFKDAPVTYWLVACVCWFLANLGVLAI